MQFKNNQKVKTDFRLLFYNTHLFGPIVDFQPGWLLTEGRVIRGIGPGMPPIFPEGFISRKIDANGLRVLPGFIDLHVHGAYGQDAMDASPDGLQEMSRFFARHGVTGFLATTWTAEREDILRALTAINKVKGSIEDGVTLLGAHLEGPYLNPERCGAQDPTLIRRADPQEAMGFLETGVVRQITLAPEFEENLWLVKECVRRGITVSAGHTAATYEEMERVIKYGLRQVTHCFNTMAPFNHRKPGVIGAALTFPEVYCELIADNVHVHPAAMKVLFLAKGADQVLLITEAIRGTGMPEGDYRVDRRVITIQNGAARLNDGTLAGSVLTLDRALKNLMSATGATLQEIWTTTSLNAVRALGISNQKGSLEVGKDADLALLDLDFNVVMTVVEGRIVCNRHR